MPPTIIVLHSPCHQMRMTSFRDNVSCPPWSLVIITPHLRHPTTAFLRHHQPLLIVVCDFLWLWYLSSCHHPLHQYTPKMSLGAHFQPITFFCSLLRCQLLVLPREWYQTKRKHHHPWCGDDAYALGLGDLKPHAMVWAKAAWHHGWHQTCQKNYLQ